MMMTTKTRHGSASKSVGGYQDLVCLLVLALSATAVEGRTDDHEHEVSKLLVFRDVPAGMDIGHPHHLIIRSSYEGSIEFIDSNQLRIEVNVSAPSLQDLARVNYNFTDYHNSILLQLFDVKPLDEVSLILYVSVLIASVFTLTFLGSLIFVCWWSVCRKPLMETDKVTCPDASQAPLLENRPPTTANQTQPMPSKSKKCCPKPLQQVPTDESCISSEDDLNEDKTLTKRGGIPSRPAQRKDKLFEKEIVTRALKELSPQKSNTGGYIDSTVSAKKSAEPTPDKPVTVSCIRMDSGSSDSHDGSCSKKGGQYIQLTGSDKRYGQEGDLEKTGTIRLRREGSSNSDMIPDVVRTRSGKGPSYVVPECPSQTQYIALKSTEGEFSDSEYSTINRAISGAKVVQILSNSGETMPRYETAERPTVKFSPDTKKPLESPVVLDTFGKPRVVEGGSEPHYATVALGGARSKDSAGHRSAKYVMQPHLDREHGSGHLSPASSSTDHSSDSGRLVDEAYGTLGSSGSSTVSSSTASTGSGSSGSVVTVIAADEAGSALLARRHLFPKQSECQLRGQSPNRPSGGTLPRKEEGSSVGYTQSGAAPKYLQMSLLCCMTMACFVTGIYALNERSTKVHIRVFAPPNFLRYKPEVFTKKGKFVNVTSSLKQDKFEIDVYEVDDPYIADLRVDPCRSMHCAQSCDAITGSCICPRGYKLIDGSKCEDINECHQGEPVCHEHSYCVNNDGKFTCECSKGYYSSGLQCQACAAPCPNGTFEVMPCSDTHPKLCRDCANSCMDGYFISAPCGPTYNTVCKSCRNKCAQSEYEYTPCLGILERQCKDIASLTKPIVSSNIIFEDRRDIKQAISPVQPQDIKDGPLTHTFVLPRGSDLTVHASILEANLAPLFRAVNHSDSNDNEGFFEDIRITQEYCPYPIPEKYQLSVVIHKGITTKAKNVTCSGRKKRSTSSRCDGESGYYLNPREKCETYSKFGIMPQLNQEGWSVLCVKPGKLSDVFDVSSELREVTTLFYDVYERCASARSECDLCILNCSYTMKNHRGGHRCNITADDADNGESPRLQYCFSCCNKQECSKVCEVYHNRDCPQLRCLTGNIAEFVLSPIFSHRSSIFACHIEPVPGYRIYDIEYYVKYKGKIVNDRTLKAQRVFDKSGHPKRAVDVHNFLKIYYGSEVETKPDLIEGDSMLKSFSAGYYQMKGQELVNVDHKPRTLYVRPKVPFAVSSKTWKKENCDTNILSNFVIASNTPPDSDPFRPDALLEVMYVSRGMYRLYNKTQGHLPSIYLEIPRDKSVLRGVYDPTTVRDDTTLKAELIRHNDEWILHISGEILKCPGAFNVIVRDPGYPSHSIFDFDVGVSCPNAFTIDFIIPTEGNDTYNKTFLVDIMDTYRTIKMTIFRPVPNMSKEVYEFFNTNASHDAPVNYNKGNETPLSIFTPPVVVLCVVVSVLAVLLFFGFVTESVEKLNLKSESKVDSQHLFFVVCYITFRATYSVAVTFTILVLLIRHFNRDSVTTLQQFSQFAETASNSQRLDIERIQSYVMEELHRQNGLANGTKQLCEDKLIQLQNQLEDAKQQMRVDSQEDRLVSQVALQYTKVLILNLTNNVNKFKHEFSVYAKKALDRLTRSIVQTSSAIQSSKWLAGAKEIYEAVRTKRSAQGLDTKPFMEWAGIEQEVDRLVADLSIKDFPMPNLTEFINIEIPKMNTKQTPIPKASDIVLPRNQWFYQYEKKPVTNDADSSSIQPAKDLKVNTNDIISLSSFLAILVAIDLVWFIHRMARTYSTAKMILYGCPVYISCKKLSDESQRVEAGKPPSSPIVNCLHFVRDLNLRVMKTEFVPKLVATVTVSCALYVMLAASDRLVTIKTLASVGYFDALVAPVETSYRLAKTRVKMNAHRINKFEFPFYEEMINVRTKRYQLLLEMYAEVQRSNSILHDSEYCMWKKMLKPDESCNCTTVTVGRLHFDGCELPPVMPLAYHRKDFGLHREQLSNSMVPYIGAARDVIMNTSHLVAIFVAVLVSVDALGSVIWIYLKRFSLLRMKPLFEIEQYPVPEPKCQT